MKKKNIQNYLMIFFVIHMIKALVAITLSGLFAETGYNLIHNIEKLIKEGKDGKYNKETSTGK